MGSVNCRVTVLAGFPGLLLGYTPPEAIPFRQGTFQFKNVNKMPLTDHEAFSCPTLLLTLSCALLLGGTNNRPWLPPTMKFKLSLALAAALFLPALVNAQVVVNPLGSPGAPPLGPGPVMTQVGDPFPAIPPNPIPSVPLGPMNTAPASPASPAEPSNPGPAAPASSTLSVVPPSISRSVPASSTPSVVSESSEYTTPASSTPSVVSSSIYTTPPSTASAAAPPGGGSVASSTPAPSSPETTPPASSQALASESAEVESFNDA